MHISGSRTRAAAGVLVVVHVLASACLAQTPPDAPNITTPAINGEIVAASDVHMETAPFSDPDIGDIHDATDWEIWQVTPLEQAWAAFEVNSAAARTHIHLGDGQFQNSHVGRTELFADTDYELRVRFRDQSGLWSATSVRTFTTGPASEVFPMEVADVADFPATTWRDTDAADLSLPGGATPAQLLVEVSTGELLLVRIGQDVGPDSLINPPTLSDHHPVRVRILAGSDNLLLPQSSISFTEDSGDLLELHLPPVNLAPHTGRTLWIATNGSSYWGDASPNTPDFTQLAQGGPVPWKVLQPGYDVEVFATGFQLPVFIAFVPNPGPNDTDPYFYVTELYGTIKVVTRDGSVSDYAANLLNFDPFGPFPGSGEKGIGGIEVEPNTGDLFAAILYDPAPPSGTHYARVIRLTSLDGGLTANSQTTVLDMPNEPMGPSHFVSNISLGPDDKLYVHMGDGLDPLTALDLTSFRGKILRVNQDGSAPIDNPFYDAQDSITATDYVFTYGLRNPFGGAWRASDGALYEVENGPARNDRLARMDAGVSYGWDGIKETMATNAIYNWYFTVAPVEIAFTETATFGGSGFPAAKMDHAFVTESGPTYASGLPVRGKRIVEFDIDNTGTLVSGPTPLIEYDGPGFATAAGLAAGPDGLYFTDLYKDTGATSPIDVGANVLRIRFVGTADFSADVTRGEYPLVVQFADLSDVPGATEWTWYFVDGSTSNLQNPQHTYTSYGWYHVRLEITAPTGLVAEQKNNYIAAINETTVEPQLPSRFRVYTGEPNPFAAETLIRYDMPQSAHVRLQVYDVAGRLVRNLVDQRQLAGTQTTRWTGTDEHGNRVGAGVYFVRLQAGRFESTRRIVRSP